MANVSIKATSYQQHQGAEVSWTGVIFRDNSRIASTDLSYVDVGAALDAAAAKATELGHVVTHVHESIHAPRWGVFGCHTK